MKHTIMLFNASGDFTVAVDYDTHSDALDAYVHLVDEYLTVRGQRIEWWNADDELERAAELYWSNV